ncbi:MAG: hypothetical protein NDF54_06430 [archaeon GB-1867-035]|nr:hypothetical protein [Candidatus Culexmicrobium profundum]
MKKLSKEEVEKLIKEVFNYYGKSRIFEEEFIKYFKQKGMTDEEIDNLWVKALNYDLIDTGLKTFPNKSNPLEPITKVVFELLEEQ